MFAVDLLGVRGGRGGGRGEPVNRRDKQLDLSRRAFWTRCCTLYPDGDDNNYGIVPRLKCRWPLPLPQGEMSAPDRPDTTHHRQQLRRFKRGKYGELDMSSLYSHAKVKTLVLLTRHL